MTGETAKRKTSGTKKNNSTSKKNSSRNSTRKSSKTSSSITTKKRSSSGKSSTKRSTTGSSTRRTTRNRSTSNRSRTGSRGYTTKAKQEDPVSRDIILIVLFALMIFLFLCNFINLGIVGTFFSNLMFGLMGVLAYVFPILIFALYFYYILMKDSDPMIGSKVIAIIGLFVIMGVIAELVSGNMSAQEGFDPSGIWQRCTSNRSGGGVIGGAIAFVLYSLLRGVGSMIVLLGLAIACIYVLGQKSYLDIMKNKAQEARRERDEELDEDEDEETYPEEWDDGYEEEQLIKFEEKYEGKYEEKYKEKPSPDLEETIVEKDKKKKEQEDTFASYRAPKYEDSAPKESIQYFHGIIGDTNLQQDDSFTEQRKEDSIIYPENMVHTVSNDTQRQEDRSGYVKEDQEGNGQGKASAGGLEEPEEANRKSDVNRAESFDTNTQELHEIHPESEYQEKGFVEDIQEREEPCDAANSEEKNGDHVIVLPTITVRGENQDSGGEGNEEQKEENAEDVTADEKITVQKEEKADVKSGEIKEESEEQNDNQEEISNDQEEIKESSGEKEEENKKEEKEKEENENVEPAAEDVQIHTGKERTPSEINTTLDEKTKDLNEEAQEKTTEYAGKSNVVSFEAAKSKKEGYQFPPIDLLVKGKARSADSEEELKETAKKLETTLYNFGVHVTITDISQGPSVTRYEMLPEMGVKVSRIVSLSDDIKLALAATDIRIEAPIPGKSAIGIEVPNKVSQPVMLRDIVDTKEFRDQKSKLAFAVGKDIAGKPVYGDIAKMPHLLIAGATGSGKSVCINTIIMSILYHARPDEVKFIMIDPKVVELSVYNGIPHLLIDVVTDPQKATSALNWAVAEMDSRYKTFAQARVRDIGAYNELVKKLDKEGKNETHLAFMPQLVVIVDELADLMMVAKNDVETSICRLAQLARAAGIHLILATQRPTVDVITGLIKANMPSRIAFRVSSGIDSRTILDMNGAEKLLGKGDMLFFPQGLAKPTRVQGCFVSDGEVNQVVAFLSKNEESSEKEKNEEDKQNVMQEMESMESAGSFTGKMGGANSSEQDVDELFVQAGRFILEKNNASIGLLQRKFRIGYNRAARIMDQLCEAGMVSESEGTKARNILMGPAEFESYCKEHHFS